jgi:hypothetical protein
VKAFIFWGRLISTWTTYSDGQKILKYSKVGIVLEDAITKEIDKLPVETVRICNGRYVREAR